MLDLKSSQGKFRLLHERLERLGRPQLIDTAASETYYIKGYCDLEETIKVHLQYFILEASYRHPQHDCRPTVMMKYADDSHRRDGFLRNVTLRCIFGKKCGTSLSNIIAC